jgi:hypothetical protein
MLARWIDEHWDLSEHAVERWKKFGVRPADLFDLTPNELLAVIGAEEEQEPFDHVAAIHHTNHVVLAGKPPVVASWMMKSVPRKHRALPAPPSTPPR